MKFYFGLNWLLEVVSGWVEILNLNIDLVVVKGLYCELIG